MKSAHAHAIAAVLLAAALGACTPGPLDVATVAPNSLPAGLVAHWTFDDAAGAIARDSSSNGRDGSIAGGPGWSWIDGRFSGALQLAGNEEVTVGLGGFGFPQATANYSVSAWLRVAEGDSEPPVAAVLSTEIPWGVGPPGGWSLNLDLPPPGSGDAGNYNFTYWFAQGPTDVVWAACACVVFDAWVHLAAVVDADSGTLTFYVDGIARQQVPVARGIWPAPGALYMGRPPIGGPGPILQLAGGLDDVAIYARALVPEEIKLLSSAPAPDPL
jgi:hypothetical protein